MRLSAKLILAFLIVGLTGVGLVALLASRATASQFGRFMFNQARVSYVDQLAAYYSANEGWAGIEASYPGAFPVERHGPHHGRGGFAALVDENGVVILPGLGYRLGQQVPESVLAGANPIQVDERTAGWLIARQEGFRPTPDEALFLERLNLTLVGGAAGAAAVSLLLGVWLSRRLTRPLRELTDATRAVAEGDLDHKVAVRSSDELGELATSFNRMSAELARSRDLRRQMTADIAHELRTPISVILGHVDAMAEGVLPATPETLDIMRDESGRLVRLVEDLRTLSQADAGELTLVRRRVDPVALLERAAAAQEPMARQKGISLSVEIEDAIPEVEVDPDRIAQVLANLLTNALRYTSEGGRVVLRAAPAEDGVEIRVSDTGRGIPAEELDNIFDRFYRADKSRQRSSGGSGLGLAIAKSLVETHGGRIRAEPVDGRGTTIVIHLPPAEGPFQAK